MAGYIVVVNARPTMGPKPDPDETVIRVDRSNPVLGNQHVLKNRFDVAERDRVIAAYQTDLDTDFAVRGPMYQAVLKIAERVLHGEAIALECWCVPSRCHASLIATKVNNLLEAGVRLRPKISQHSS